MSTPTQRPPAAPGTDADRPDEPLIHLWILRLLVELGGHRRFLRENHFARDSFARALGLDRWIDDNAPCFSPAAVLGELRGMLRSAQRKPAGNTLRGEPCFEANLRRLAGCIGLNAAEVDVFRFAVCLHHETMLDEAASFLGHLTSAETVEALSTLLGHDKTAVRLALSSRGALVQAGLVEIDRSGRNTLRAKLKLLSESFVDRLLTEDGDPTELLRDLVVPGKAPTLALADYAHIDSVGKVLLPYLERCLEEKRCGVNVLIHGAPGTGKTELSRVLAAELGTPLFEVASSDEDGDPVSGNGRLRAYRAAQSFFARNRALLLFDEVEDVFEPGETIFARRGENRQRKGWINRALENNPVPTLWLSNSVEWLDAAFVRRFDVVLEVVVPPAARARIVDACCGDLLAAPDRARLAAAEALAPAVVARVAKVVRSIRERLPADQVSPAVCSLIDATLAAQGHHGLPPSHADALPGHYEPRYVNVDVDLTQIALGLQRSRGGRLCFYGPPGTGKSAVGRWLADRLQMPLHARRVSDIVAPWVGATERNLARAFRQAQTERAVLLLDEVDSFLQERRGARHSWQITEVNEMLTQMESFDGIFIATTNLMEGLDAAALRRFALKLCFGYLTAAHAAELLAATCAALGLEAPSAADFNHLSAAQAVTPGDFAAASRQHRFRPLADASALVHAVLAECALKKDAPRRAIGFG